MSAHGSILQRFRLLSVPIFLCCLFSHFPLDPSLFLDGNKLVHLLHQPLGLNRLERNVNVPAMWNRDIDFSRRFYGHFLDLP